MNRSTALLGLLSLALFQAAPLWGDIWTGYLSGRSVVGIRSDAGSKLIWFATNQGAFSFDGTTFIPYNVITTNGGLASDELTCLIIDDADWWFGTVNRGVSRFNLATKTWTTYNTSTSAIASNFIRCMALDSRGYLWIGTDGAGVSRFNRRNEWKNLNQANGLSGNRVLAIAIDQSDNKWFGTLRQGVSMLAADSVGCSTSSPWCYFLRGSNTTVQAIFIEAGRNGASKWFGTGKLEGPTADRNVFKLLADNRTWQNPPMDPRLNEHNVHAIQADADGNKWFGTDEGAYRLDFSETQWKQFRGGTNLGPRAIVAIVPDYEDNLWFGAQQLNGAIKYTANWITYTTSDSLSDNTVNALSENLQGTIWAGTQFGLSELQGTFWQKYGFTSGRNRITAIRFDGRNDMWMGTASGGALLIPRDSAVTSARNFHKENSGLGDNTIRAIALDDTAVWFGTSSGLYRYSPAEPDFLKWTPFTNQNTSSGLVHDEVRALAFDHTGTLWCGTRRGVSRFIGSEWLPVLTTADGLAGDWINDIAFDSVNKVIWFATEGAGVSRYDLASRQWQSIDVRDGLAGNFVNAIAIDRLASGVWLGTTSGASFRDAQGTLTTYTTQHGLGANIVLALLYDHQDRLWFGTVFGGVTRYKRKKNRPKITLLNRFDLTTESEASFRFLGADVGTPSPLLRYAYKLDHQKYSAWTFDTFARISIPDTGLHTFCVKTIDTDGNESDSTRNTFYRIFAETGKVTPFVFPEGFRGLKPIEIKLYWPPYQLLPNTKVSITPVDVDSVDSSSLLAYDLSFQEGGLDTLLKPVTLTFKFPQQPHFDEKKLAVHREFLRRIPGFGGVVETVRDTVRLGGTVKVENNTVHMSVPIRKLGRYLVQAEAPAPSASIQEAAKVSAQPRIFSPNGSGHGGETTLSFLLQNPANVQVKVYNLAGRLVKIVWDQPMNAGLNAVAWNGRDEGNRICPSGLYLMVVESSEFESAPLKPVKVMVLNE